MRPFGTAAPNDVAFCETQEQDQKAASSETACYVQPALVFNWGLAGPIPEFDCDPASIFNNTPNGRAGTHPEVTSIVAPRCDKVVFTCNNYIDDYNCADFGFPPSLTQTPHSRTPPVSDKLRAGLAPSLTQMTVVRRSVATSSGILAPTATCRAELACTFGQNQFTSNAVAIIDGSVAGQIALEKEADPSDFDPFDFAGHAVGKSFPEGQWPGGLCELASTEAAPAPDTLLPRMSLGKRRRGVVGGLDEGGPRADDGQGPRPRKKGKAKITTTIGAMETRGSKMSYQNPAARTPDTKMRMASGAVRRGAERLAPPSAQGVPSRFLQGPSVQQELRVTTAREQQPWIEGSAQGATWWHLNSMTQQKENEIGSVVDGEPEAAEGNISHIRKGIKERYRALLRGTSADWESGVTVIRQLKCQLCPGANFSNWEDFKRHCNTMEAHPLKILFCRYCGDFFARTDSLERHQRSRPPECFDITPDEAEAKRRETKRVHEVFKERLERCLKTNEEIGTPFAQIIREMYPNSSKRGSRQQSRLKAGKERS